MSLYAELAITSNFSFLRGASHPEEYAVEATALGLAGIGIADRNSVAGVVRAHSIAKEKNVRLAVGPRLVFARCRHEPRCCLARRGGRAFGGDGPPAPAIASAPSPSTQVRRLGDGRSHGRRGSPAGPGPGPR